MIGMLLAPVATYAATFRSGQENVTVPKDETVTGDLYAAGRTVTIDGTVNGDVFAAGGTVTITGTVNGSVQVAGGQIDVSGTVARAVRAAGGNITVSGTVNGDFVVAGGMVTLANEGKVQGETWATGNMIEVGGSTGSATVHATQLHLAQHAHIQGDLTYDDQTDFKADQGAVITGQTIKHALPTQPAVRRFITATHIVAAVLWVIVLLVFIYVFPNKSANLVTTWRTKFWANLGWGIGAIILTPLVALLLAVTGVGIPLAAILMLAYIVVLFLGYVVGMLAVGMFLLGWWRKDKNLIPDWPGAVAGVAVFIVLPLIPIIGWLILVATVIAGLGALLRFDWQLYRRFRADNTL